MSQFRRTLRRTIGRTFRGKSHRKTQVSTADLAASLLPTPRPALGPVQARAPLRRRKHRGAGYVTGRGGQRIFRVS